jgi:predicted XRE-type DNA-binding protein
VTKIEKSSGNVFADLGFPDAETHQIKACLVHRISELIDARNFTQIQAAKLLGMSQPDVSKMLRGQFRSISVDRLMQCLLALGDNIEISIASPQIARPKVAKATPNKVKRGKLSVVAA